MWLTGYWMEHGYRPEEILELSPEERSVWQAIAELNMEKRKQDMKEAVLEAFTEVFKAIASGKGRG